MPYSFTHFDRQIFDWIRSNYPDGSRIVDLGCGAGKYGKMLRDYYQVDAVEVFEPYVSRFELVGIYAEVVLADVLDWVLTVDPVKYRLAILGDVVEHLSATAALDLMNQIRQLGMDMLVAVPYQMSQGIFEMNPAEIHLQADLTPRIVGSRFPRLQPLAIDHKYGVYFDKVNEEHKHGGSRPGQTSIEV